MDNRFEEYKTKIEKSIIKKALGYNYKEVIDEYAIDGNQKTLVKRKITTKNVPPDLSAVKMLLDEITKEQKDYSNMTDKEIVDEIKQVLAKLTQQYDKKNEGENDED